MFQSNPGYKAISRVSLWLPVYIETVSQMLQHPAQTGKEIFMFHHWASRSGERANVPPEPLFSLCHLLVLLLSLSLSPPSWSGVEAEGGGGEEEEEGDGFLLNIT